MKINIVRLYHFQIPLKQMLRLKTKYIQKRKGYIIEIVSNNGFKGYGEIAPLPFFHQETLQQAMLELLRLSDDLIGKEVETLLEEEISCFSSVSWGIETALWNLYAFSQNTQPFYIWKPDASNEVELNGLVAGNLQEIRQQINDLLTEGVRTIKIKVGKNSIEEDIKNIEYIRDTYDKNIKIRLDANRSWKISEAQNFIEKAYVFDIEYLEEPVLAGDLKYTIENSPIPIALDESIYQKDITMKTIPIGTGAIVIKPSMLGIYTARKWIKWCQENKVKCTISSAFDTSIGLYMLANLAAICSSPAGLMTYKWLRQDVIVSPFFPVNGKIKLEKNNISTLCNVVKISLDSLI